jgi:NAD(P) transhydrogenase subunit alpha
MKLGIPKEVHPGERRVAVSPENVKRLQKLGFELIVETGAGQEADFSDASYEEAGCEIAADAAALWSGCDVVLKLREPEMHPTAGKHEVDLLPEGGTLISFLWPDQNEELVERLAARKANAIAMDKIPRISRAQKMDALSSMANISGYRAVIEAAQNFGRFFTGQITAAGKVAPAKVLVIGAGVAGLAAIGAARGLGAVVRAFDTRPAVKEQIESMGAEFVTIDFDEDGTGAGGYGKVMSEAFMEAERRLFEEQAKEVDVIITTALIPGKPAPDLLTEQVLKNLKDGSVVVDLAAERGGNCKLCESGKVVTKHGVKIIGYTDLPSRMASVASNLYGNNLYHLLDDMGGAEGYKINEEDEVVRGALVLREGEKRWPPPPPKKEEKPAEAKEEAPKPTPKPTPEPTLEPEAPKSTEKKPNFVPLLIAGLALVAVGWGGGDEFLSHFTVFVLACFVGWQIIWNVSAALHTPLMSVTNAISGIIIIGGIYQIGGDPGSPATILGIAAIFFATINIAGGFLVTQRMLKMFHR